MAESPEGPSRQGKACTRIDAAVWRDDEVITMGFRNIAGLACSLVLLNMAPVSASPQSSAVTFVNERLNGLLEEPVLITAVRKQNQKHASLSSSQIDTLDKDWRAGDRALISSKMSGALAERLAEMVADSGGAFSEIFVMDNRGLNVAQSAPTSDYWQGDEAKWQETFLVGPGASHVSDVEEDESSQTFQIQVSLPVVDGGVVIGAITLGVDVSFLE